jgi:hypothetical protein
MSKAQVKTKEGQRLNVEQTQVTVFKFSVADTIAILQDVPLCATIGAIVCTVRDAIKGARKYVRRYGWIAGVQNGTHPIITGGKYEAKERHSHSGRRQ